MEFQMRKFQIRATGQIVFLVPEAETNPSPQTPGVFKNTRCLAQVSPMDYVLIAALVVSQA
jgi:hypothetical protein